MGANKPLYTILTQRHLFAGYKLMLGPAQAHELLLRDELSKQLEQIATIKFPASFYNLKEKGWNRELQVIIAEHQKAIKNMPGAELYVAMGNLEKKIAVLMNKVLTDIGPQTQLDKVSNKLDVLNQLNHALIDVNLTLAKHVNPIMQQQIAVNSQIPFWQHMQQLEGKIVCKANIPYKELEEDKTLQKNLRETSEIARSLIFTTFLKGARTQEEQELVKELSQQLTGNKGLSVLPSYSCVPGESMAVSCSEVTGFAKAENQELISIAIRDKQAINANAGCGSTMTVPIVMSVEEIGDAEEMRQFFHQANLVYNVSHQMLQGALSFDAKGASFIPFSVELTHELIHVIHNAEGVNARNLQILENEASLWHSYEEYITVKGGNLNEAQFITSYGARVRESHVGTGTGTLFNLSEREKTKTIAAIMRDLHPHEHDHDLQENFRTRYQEIVARRGKSPEPEDLSAPTPN